MINRKKGLLLIVAIIVLCGCSDNDEDARTPEALPIPERSKMVLFESINSDGHQTDRTDTYLYNDSKLRKHTAHQSYFGTSIAQEVNATYRENQAIFTDLDGNTATYTLAKNGYATRCTYRNASQIREYTFAYTEDFLTRIDEEIDGVHFSSIELLYKQGELQAINKEGNVIFFQTNQQVNLYQLPCLFMLELHPLSMHTQALFAHLLGRQSYHFVGRSTPKRSTTEWTDYSYRTDQNDRPTEIVATTTSTGTVYDNAGNQHEVTRADKRVIKIEVE